ncbi:MAG TPA: hypothetical protein VGH89_16320 [Pseudonocardia sp.]|jgi:hypothetical protein
MTITAANTHQPREVGADVCAAMDAFAAWLAARPLPDDRRQAYHHAIDRFWAWRRLHPDCGDPAWYYLSGLCGSLISDSQLDITREALALWNTYQRAERSVTPTD